MRNPGSSAAPAPTFLYGTAWKEQETERLTRLALETGFRGVDTANQRRHYFEAGVGAAVKKAIAGAVRAFCRAKGIVYQGFSLLTANGRELQHPAFLRLVARVGKTPAQVVFRFAQLVGMLPLTGTTDVGHMREDLEANRFELSEEDVRLVETIATVATAR